MSRAAEPFEPEGIDWHPVSPRLRLARHVVLALSFGLPTVLLTVGAVVWGGWSWLAPAILAVVTVWSALLVPRQVRAIGYAEREADLLIRKGVMFTNTMGYANPRVDELFAQGASATTEAARAAAYSEVQRILVEDVPVAWLVESRTPTIYNRRVKDLITTALGAYDSLDSTYIAG